MTDIPAEKPSLKDEIKRLSQKGISDQSIVTLLTRRGYKINISDVKDVIIEKRLLRKRIENSTLSRGVPATSGVGSRINARKERDKLRGDKLKK